MRIFAFSTPRNTEFMDFSFVSLAQNDKLYRVIKIEICKNFKKFTNFHKKFKKMEFLKKFLLELQKRHYVSQPCVTMAMFK